MPVNVSRVGRKHGRHAVRLRVVRNLRCNLRACQVSESDERHIRWLEPPLPPFLDCLVCHAILVCKVVEQVDVFAAKYARARQGSAFAR